MRTSDPTRRYIPEDRTLHNHRCENLKLLPFCIMVEWTSNDLGTEFLMPNQKAEEDEEGLN
jgi:hypothetical protein